MLEITDLPTVNAILNSISAILLVTGYTYIRKQKIEQHKKCMLAAFGVSVLFLISYCIYHANAGSTKFLHGGMDTSCLLYNSDFAYNFSVHYSPFSVSHAIFGMA